MFQTLKLDETHHVNRRAIMLLNVGLVCVQGAVLWIQHRNASSEPLVPQSEVMALADHAYQVGRQHERDGLADNVPWEAPQDVPGWVPDDVSSLVDEPSPRGPVDASLVDDETPHEP